MFFPFLYIYPIYNILGSVRSIRHGGIVSKPIFFPRRTFGECIGKACMLRIYRTILLFPSNFEVMEVIRIRRFFNLNLVPLAMVIPLVLRSSSTT